jgi:hypothetical protein
VNVFHATFQADGIAKDFTTQVGFTDVLGTGYSISCQQDRAQVPPPGNYLLLALPSAVTPGLVCGNSVAGCALVYQDPSGRWLDARRNGSTFRITVTAWPGMGGQATGTFEASIRDDQGATVVLSGGNFEGFIHN